MKCTSCKINREDSFFIKENGSFSTMCSKCRNRYKRFYEKNKDKIKQQSKKYFEKNKDQIKIKRHQRYDSNKEEIKKQSKKYRENNKEKNKKTKELYIENNKETFRNSQNNYIKKRRKNDPLYKMRKSISNAINIAIKKNGGNKNNKSIINYLPYSLEELRNHIEKQFLLPGNEWMNWSNQGIYIKNKWDDNDKTTWTWQIDHIIPHSSFKYSSMEDEEFKKCWALSNLRPLSAKENILKKDKLIT